MPVQYERSTRPGFYQPGHALLRQAQDDIQLAVTSSQQAGFSVSSLLAVFSGQFAVFHPS